MFDQPDDRAEVKALLENLRAALPDLERHLEAATGHWGYEDPVYRFYHHSFKVFDLQNATSAIVAVLQKCAPERKLTESFLRIIREGTGKRFATEDNVNWLTATRPILEAFFHARYFLEMSVRYARTLEVAPRELPSGWAALLELYELR